MNAIQQLQKLFVDDEKYRIGKGRTFLLGIMEAVNIHAELSQGQLTQVALWIQVECNHLSDSFNDGLLLEMRSRMDIARFINTASASITS